MFRKFFQSNAPHSQPTVAQSSQELPISASVVQMFVAATIPKEATHALLQCQGADIRIRTDGIAPTASVGRRMKADDSQEIPIGDFQAMQAVAESADAILWIDYLV